MNSAAHVMQLQQQAAARVKEMAERSRRLVEDHPVTVYRGVTVAPLLQDPPPAPAPPHPPVTVPCHKPEQTARGGLLSLFGGDNERLLLLLLAAVLAKNGAPMELLLAILYIAF